MVNSKTNEQSPEIIDWFSAEEENILRFIDVHSDLYSFNKYADLFRIVNLYNF